jgi:hypothetical protein
MLGNDYTVCRFGSIQEFRTELHGVTLVYAVFLMPFHDGAQKFHVLTTEKSDFVIFISLH